MNCSKNLAAYVLLLLLAGLWACTGQPSAVTHFTQQSKVDVYFFHTRHKCETCDAIKNQTTESLSTLFGDEVFLGIYNIDQDGKELAESLGIKTLTLLVVKDDVRIDLTNEAYLYARSDPDKFRLALEEAIKPLLQ